MEEQSNVAWRGGKKRRSVKKILARRRNRGHRRRVFPPDFAHGDVAMGSIYDILGARWVERALFAVDDGAMVTVGYFDDHFLVVEQWEPDDDRDWERWWRARTAGRDRIVALQTTSRGRIGSETRIAIDVTRRRLRRLERHHLGVVREAGCTGTGDEERRRRGEIDVLSLVALTSRFCSV